MGIYSKAGSVKAGAGNKRPALPAGFYPELMIEEIREFDGTDPTKPGAHYYAVDLEVVSDGAPAGRGTGGTFLQQDAGSLPSFNMKAIGAIKDFLGCVFGYKEQADRTNKVGEAEILASFAPPGTALTGHVVSAKVSHGKTTNPGVTICNFEFGPVFGPDGKPKRIERPAPGSAPAAAAPPPAVAPPPPAGPPPGWVRHPDPQYGAQGWFHDPSTPGSTPQRFPGA